MVVERYAGDILEEEITMNVEVVTRASVGADLCVGPKLYGQDGDPGRFQQKPESGRGYRKWWNESWPGSELEHYDVAVTLQPVQAGCGWNTANLMSEPYDISTYKESAGTVLLLTTDSR